LDQEELYLQGDIWTRKNYTREIYTYKAICGPGRIILTRRRLDQRELYSQRDVWTRENFIYKAIFGRVKDVVNKETFGSVRNVVKGKNSNYCNTENHGNIWTNVGYSNN
jgi:hypothetical protein